MKRKDWRTVPRRCRVCGEEFSRTVGHQMYCGRDCRLEAQKKPATCKGCGAEYQRIGERQKFCSMPCARKHTAQVRAGGTGRFGLGVSHAQGPWKRICGVCKDTFETESRTQQYCGKSCRSKAIAAGRRGDKPAGRRWGITAKGEEECRNCGCEADHLHHVVPRSKSKAGVDDLRNGIPLCFDCHRGWHDRRVVIPLWRLKPDELRFAAEISDDVWLERNYPPTTPTEESNMVFLFGGLEGAYEEMTRHLGQDYADVTRRKRGPGDTVKEYLSRSSV